MARKSHLIAIKLNGDSCVFAAKYSKYLWLDFFLVCVFCALCGKKIFAAGDDTS